ncbi:ABC transporter permease [Candidatus Enterococcus murrayae]|uniref:ABC transporter permease n=1 Tax=Enterococcus TaxID=1350 RepID=UPI001F5D5056|nr:ABC transporter permease [Enterococcus sp. MJM16]
MIIIRHAWLNLKRNRFSHLKLSCFIFLLTLIVFSMLQIYRRATIYFTEYRDQAATVVKGVQDLNQTGQANKLNTTDYEQLKHLPYVKRSQLTGQSIISSSIAQPTEQDQTAVGYYSFSSEANNGNYLPVTMLDDDSLKTLLTDKKEQLQGTVPLEKGTCVISEALANANKLKVNDTIQLGAKGQEQKVRIAGIANYSTTEQLATLNTLLINWKTETMLQKNIMQPFSSVMFQLTSKKEIKKFVKDFKKMDSFKNYSLISQSWSQGLLQTTKDTLDLLFNGLIVALILGVVLIAAVYQYHIKQRKDFYTLHLMGLDRRVLSFSSSLEYLVIVIVIGLSAFFTSQQLSRWITGEWLLKLQKNLAQQEPFVDWLLPHFEQNAWVSWQNYAGAFFLGVGLLIMLLLVNFRITQIIRDPLQEVARR